MERIDKYLSVSGKSSSREQAKKELLAGWVKIDGETCYDVSRKVEGTENITVARPKGAFISRGGYKLEKALDSFGIDLQGVIATDLGASTGGFTDCMLKRGAVRVYAVDVGYGQLDYSLRFNERVVVMERTNARHLQISDFNDDLISFVSADLSFISFTKIFPVIRDLFPKATGVALIKPQFEAERSEHKKGVIRSPEIHKIILLRVLSSLEKAGCKPAGLTFSPITGPKGNIEFLLYFSVYDTEPFQMPNVDVIVEHAWDELK
ncbi:MAG: TlyA family RNA methyltransferase [Spirochaetes bacterium]|nr:TlyA family RNA methyltransferase [Spirochaetota bacterium]